MHLGSTIEATILMAVGWSVLITAMKMPAFPGGPHRVWGLSAIVMAGILDDAVRPRGRVRSGVLDAFGIAGVFNPKVGE